MIEQTAHGSKFHRVTLDDGVYFVVAAVDGHVSFELYETEDPDGCVMYRRLTQDQAANLADELSDAEVLLDDSL